MVVSQSTRTEPNGAPDEDEAPAAPRSRTQTTRRRLLEAGRELFAKHGPREVTSHAIAARAGYAAGTFYLHFKDKLALFRELAEDAAGELENRLLALEDDGAEPHEIVRAQAEVLVGFAEDQRDLLRILFHPGSEAAGIGAGILERLAQTISQRRRSLLGAGQAQDCFDTDVLAQAIVGMWAHVLAWWAEDPTRASRDDIVRTLSHFQVHGNRAEAATLCTWPPGDPER